MNFWTKAAVITVAAGLLLSGAVHFIATNRQVIVINKDSTDFVKTTPAGIPAAMQPMTCAIAGDSIVSAEGMGKEPQFKKCILNARVGAGVPEVESRLPKSKVNLLIISAGTNGWNGPNLPEELTNLRIAAQADQVVWIDPVVLHAAGVVEAVAYRFKDKVVTFVPGCKTDQNNPGSGCGIHPGNYQKLAEDVCRVVNCPK